MDANTTVEEGLQNNSTEPKPDTAAEHEGFSAGSGDEEDGQHDL
jgi:hypothetical protein